MAPVGVGGLEERGRAARPPPKAPRRRVAAVRRPLAQEPRILGHAEPLFGEAEVQGRSVDHVAETHLRRAGAGRRRAAREGRPHATPSSGRPPWLHSPPDRLGTLEARRLGMDALGEVLGGAHELGPPVHLSIPSPPKTHGVAPVVRRARSLRLCHDDRGRGAGNWHGSHQGYRLTLPPRRYALRASAADGEVVAMEIDDSAAHIGEHEKSSGAGCWDGSRQGHRLTLPPRRSALREHAAALAVGTLEINGGVAGDRHYPHQGHRLTLSARRPALCESATTLAVVAMEIDHGAAYIGEHC